MVTGASRMVLTGDPITFAGSAVGRYAVAVNCNDLVAMGAEPRYFTTTLLLPPGTTRRVLQGLFAELAAAAASAGIAWVGGHTEITGAVTRPVVAGAAVGVLDGEPWSSARVRPGDAVVLTKWVALEGTTLLARERADAGALLGDQRAAAAGWLDDPGIGVAAEGRVLRAFAIHAAHDPTEGGVAQGVHELADCSGVAIEIEAAALPIREPTRRLCRALRIDPLGLLASGALLFSAAPEVACAAVAALRLQGIPACVIGAASAGPRRHNPRRRRKQPAARLSAGRVHPRRRRHPGDRSRPPGAFCRRGDRGRRECPYRRQPAGARCRRIGAGMRQPGVRERDHRHHRRRRGRLSDGGGTSTVAV